MLWVWTGQLLKVVARIRRYVCLTDSDDAFAAGGWEVLALALGGCEADRGAPVCCLAALVRSCFAGWREQQMGVLGALSSRVWAEVGGPALVARGQELGILHLVCVLRYF